MSPAKKAKKTKKNGSDKNENNGAETRRNDDGAWKFLIGKFFYDMLRRCLPDLYEDADRQRPPVFLDKELGKISGQVKGRRRVVDFLVSVPMKRGLPDECVWIHVEVQGGGGEDLSTRMFRYMALIYALHGVTPAALAIMTEKRSKSEPRFYSSSMYGTALSYTYNALDISELDPVELEASDNTFDLALLASQKAVKSRRDERMKHSFLKELIGSLGERGWNHESKFHLLQFLEAIINLTDEVLKEDITTYEKNLEKEEKIMLVSYAEQVGIKKGEQIGIEKGKIEIVRNMLAKGLSTGEVADLTGLTEEQIACLLGARRDA
jgi:hypothetical protein